MIMIMMMAIIIHQGEEAEGAVVVEEAADVAERGVTDVVPEMVSTKVVEAEMVLVIEVVDVVVEMVSQTGVNLQMIMTMVSITYYKFTIDYFDICLGQEKKREIYTPPEKSTDENDIFHSGNTTGINFTKYDSIEVKTTGENVPPPITTFESACLKELLLKNIIKSNYTKPTPIQKHSLPIILGGRDLMACAQTGSGKTV